MDDIKTMARLTEDENILRELAVNKDPTVRRIVAENLHTPGEVLMDLSTDKHKRVVNAAMNNPNMPEDLLAAWIMRHIRREREKNKK